MDFSIFYFSHPFATLNVNPKLIILPYSSFYKLATLAPFHELVILRI